MTSVEGLEPSSIERAAGELAQQHSVSRQRSAPIELLQNPQLAANWLQRVRQACTQPDPDASKAAEWLLDNDYQISRALLQIREDMPEAFFEKLPALSDGGPCGPRILVLAHEFLKATHLQVSLASAVNYVAAYQTDRPLTIAELWAFPVMLRIASIETLVSSLAVLLGKPAEPGFAVSPCALEGRSLDATERVARSILNLGEAAAISWEDFFERTSVVEKVLRRDPCGTYAKMDFATRDSYRVAIEDIAQLGNLSETEVAEEAVARSRCAGSESVEFHVGYWLVDEGRSEVESHFAVRPGMRDRLDRLVSARPGRFFAFAMLFSALMCSALPVLYLVLIGAEWFEVMIGLFLSQIPASILAITLIHWIVNRSTRPRVLPKLDSKAGIPRGFPVAVAIPTVIASHKEVEPLARQMERHWLANEDPGLQIILLADLADAHEDHRPGDAAILDALVDAVENLNERYGMGNTGPFQLLVRPRLWNERQGCWMAWERKRGKLEQFNRLILEGDSEPFCLWVGDRMALDLTRFVVTLDADTMLPSGSVAKLASALAHPLNLPRLSNSGKLERGYSIIQPRVEIAPVSGGRSLFERFFTGETTIDIYSRAVSDFYQDLFGAGIFVGKGIYDLAAFHAVTDGKVPENAVLSHDLFEGSLGRAGLATDIVLYEGFPDTYRQYAQRLHRWVRGDWQLFPWVVGRARNAKGERIVNPLRGIDRWKAFDNLRRSCVQPGLVALALAGWFFLPGSPWFWTALVVLAPAGQLFIDFAAGLSQRRRNSVSYVVRSRVVNRIGRWLLALAFMLHEALLSFHAISLTMWRLFVSRRNMLEWKSAAHVAAQDAGGDDALNYWIDMLPSVVIAMGIGSFLVLFQPEAVLPAFALIVPWVIAPEIARIVHRRPPAASQSVEQLDSDYLRQLARRTWLYFEVFAGPADSWLPPDNYQGHPHEEIAHRTSPTNIGMMLLSTASAWDMGFIGRAELVARTRNAFESLAKLERYRGHFLNWYETHHLRPLEPRYVSTVDSGNLAASLIAFAGCLRDAASSSEFEQQRWSGLRDVALLAAAQARALRRSACADQLDGIALAAASPPEDHDSACRAIETLEQEDLPKIEAQCRAVMEAMTELQPETVRDLNAWLGRLGHQVHEMHRDLRSPERLSNDLLALADDAETLAWSMDFAWLYDRERRLFRIGYNVSTAQPDTNHYDLLASEARIASFFAIAKKDVGIEHWFHLGRPITRSPEGLALVSWNGSMFEYLMPRIVMPSDPETILGESDRVAVHLHRTYRQSDTDIWGISESAYAARDPEFRFRYRAFGVPGLGLRRGLAQDLVIAPYASALALAIDPVSSQANLKRLDELGAGGRYGLWDAVDLTPERAEGRPGGFAPVNVFMAHHQGMVMSAIANLLIDDVHVRRFTRQPRIDLATLLLSERIPHELPSELKRIETAAEVGENVAASDLRMSWQPAKTAFPQTHMFGNGRMACRISDQGGGGLLWNGQIMTQFTPDAVRDADGAWLYLRDERTEQVWSATRRPIGTAATEERVTFHTHAAEIQRLENQIRTRLQLTIGASEDIELRNYELVNESDQTRSLRATSYVEIALAPPLEHERHPAFSKLFVKSAYVESVNALIFTRRPRRPEDTPPVLLQAMIAPESTERKIEFETDRRSFIGRSRSIRDPIGVVGGLDGGLGWTLDPAASFQVKLQLDPGEKCEISIITIAAASREAALDILARHSGKSATRWLMEDAAGEASRAISRSRIAPEDLPALQSLGSLLVYPHGALRADEAVIRQNRLGQSNLWGLALSGDLPILLVKEVSEDTGLLQTLVGAHQLWRRAGLHVDLVILQTLGSTYIEPARDTLAELLQEVGAAELLGRHGGIHLIFADQVGGDQIRLLEAMAWAILDGDGGPLADQIELADIHRLEVPPILPALDYEPETEAALNRPDSLELDNGYGGFVKGGHEYLIHLDPGASTPAPWANVLANEYFGTLVTEMGGGFTWSINSGEHRLTPWTNDPVSDRQTEVLYLRDEETTQVWSVTPAPAGRDATCQIRHGAGFTEWRQASRGIDQTMRVLVARDAPVKLVRLKLRNLGKRDRRLTATFYAEWLMGALSSVARSHVHCRFDHDAQAILACNPWNVEFAERAAFLTASEPSHSFTTDRAEFLGKEGDLASPAALSSSGLDHREVAGSDACGAFQVHIDLPHGETREVLFVMGEAASQDKALELAREWRSLEKAEAEELRLADYWDNLLGSVEVQTPDRGLDILVNRWLLYQSLSSRIFARTGFYQASGAIGFRDQLQDMLSLLHVEPERAREHILECARHQFTDGDVLHWWHPPSGRGVRTRISDDLLWLPYAAAHYVNVTGDISILTEDVRFLEAPPLADQEHDRYAKFPSSVEVRPLIEHCERALERVELGSNGLPLIGAGDWNDGMDRVGDKGRGESVWLAWFASVCAASLAHCERRLGRTLQSRFWAQRAATWRRNAEKSGWDGEWYRRAYDDEGSPLGSQQNAECWIDSISQSWSVFAGGNTSRSRTALQAALRELFDEEAGISRLLWAPFEQSDHDPGYIMSYPPGIRENGGQYSHAAAWLGLAFARTGQGDHAHRIFSALNPLCHTKDRAGADKYLTEPYVVAADIGGVDSYRGRGGWTWYTGAAGWTWRLAIEGILGLTLHEGMLDISPALPSDWDGYEATLRRNGGTIRLRLTREGPASGRGRPHIFIDGEPVPGDRIAFPPDGQTIEVRAVLGRQSYSSDTEGQAVA